MFSEWLEPLKFTDSYLGRHIKEAVLPLVCLYDIRYKIFRIYTFSPFAIEVMYSEVHALEVYGLMTSAT